MMFILFKYIFLFLYIVFFIKKGWSKNCALRGWEEFKVDFLLGLSSFRPIGIESFQGWVRSGLSSNRDWVLSGLSLFRVEYIGVESLQGWVHSWLSPFEVEPICGWVPFGLKFIWGWVHSGLSSFGVGSTRRWVHSGLGLSRFSHSRFSCSMFCGEPPSPTRPESPKEQQ